ncbi:hypothetical protein DID76_03795 [Candidatus Marinamargulisbacteria bacterium SCGC AG-414-C22]|nr:hypothetical protein DID76_03795 [Candidatus Marinamargulisbacteria bacterium SCGC AG-414-C22]
MINFCIFEDSYYKNLLPLTELRPACDLLVGTSSIYDKIHKEFNYGNITIHCRDYLKPTLKKSYPNISINNINTGAPCLFINGRLILDSHTASIFSKIKEKNNYLFTYNNQVVATFLRGDLLNSMSELLKDQPNPTDIITLLRHNCITKELENIHLLSNLKDIIIKNPAIIEQDFKQANQLGIIKGTIKPYTAIYNENNVFINENTIIEDFVLIDASKGPVYIDDHVTIEANSRLEGPLYIGSHSKIYGGKVSRSSIGTHCKIAGEISQSIFQGFSNKAHSGFIGHSYIGQWVNLGANTTTSNLKNNYSTIKLVNQNQVIDTGELFIGAFIGDHVKTSINTTINTGSVIHMGSNIIHSPINYKEIPPFSWGPSATNEKYDLNKFIITAKNIMKRRHIELSKNNEELFQYLHNKYCYEKINV